MARNGKSGDGHRNGAVDDRSQFKHPNGHWIKRDADTGKIMDLKSNERPFKGDYSEIAYELGLNIRGILPACSSSMLECYRRNIGAR